MWDEAVRMGRENQQIIEFARRHCLNMEFVQSGGRGMVEEQTGLPVDMRQIRCPVAFGGMASNLSLIIDDFYRDHCVGCVRHRPTGEVPNLATVIGGRNAEAARQAALRDAEVARAREQWRGRAELRRAVAASGGEAMADAVANIAVLDAEPGTDIEPAAREAARERLSALAERAPQVFTPEVVSLATDLIAVVVVTQELLDPLRRLASRRPEFAVGVLRAALRALRGGPVVQAGRCVADLAKLLSIRDVDEQVCRSSSCWWERRLTTASAGPAQVKRPTRLGCALPPKSPPR
jgi:hypothetical protein